MTAVIFEVQNHLAEDIQIDSSIGAHFVVRAGQAAQVNLPTEGLTKLWVVIARPGDLVVSPAQSDFKRDGGPVDVSIPFSEVSVAHDAALAVSLAAAEPTAAAEGARPGTILVGEAGPELKAKPTLVKPSRQAVSSGEV